jgi:uncharacterized protein (UPF0332 family)
MKGSSKQLLEKASRAIEASSILLDSGFTEFSSGRAYYAMFYTVEALLNEKDLKFSKHGGVHSAFGEHFIKTGLFDAKYHRWLLDAFDRRIESDYGSVATVTDDDARELIEQAKEFLREAKTYFQKQE